MNIFFMLRFVDWQKYLRSSSLLSTSPKIKAGSRFSIAHKNEPSLISLSSKNAILLPIFRCLWAVDGIGLLERMAILSAYKFELMILRITRPYWLPVSIRSSKSLILLNSHNRVLYLLVVKHTVKSCIPRMIIVFDVPTL